MSHGLRFLPLSVLKSLSQFWPSKKSECKWAFHFGPISALEPKPVQGYVLLVLIPDCYVCQWALVLTAEYFILKLKSWPVISSLVLCRVKTIGLEIVLQLKGNNYQLTLLDRLNTQSTPSVKLCLSLSRPDHTMSMIQMMLTPAQGTQSPLLGVFPTFRCVFKASG